MQRALDSAIGLPSSSTSAFWMLGLLMPEEQRRNFTMPPVSSTPGETFYALSDSSGWRLAGHQKLIARLAVHGGPSSAVPDEPRAGESKCRSDEIRQVDAVALR